MVSQGCRTGAQTSWKHAVNGNDTYFQFEIDVTLYLYSTMYIYIEKNMMYQTL
jgi:hypothetical protein